MTDAIRKAERLALEIVRARDPEFGGAKDPELAPTCKRVVMAQKLYLTMRGQPMTCIRADDHREAHARAQRLRATVVEALRK